MNLSTPTARRILRRLLPAALLLLAACAPIRAEPDSAGGSSAAAPTAAPAAQVSTPAEPEDSAVGIYKGFFPGASSPGLDATLYLNGDGSLQLVSDYLNGEEPAVDLGQWEAQGDDVQITLVGPGAQAATFTLTLTGDRLTAVDWIGPWYRFDALAAGLSPAYDATSAAAQIAADGVIGFYKRFAPAADCCGQDTTLLLAADNSVELKTDFLNGEPPVVEVGTWEATGEGVVGVSLTGRRDGTVYDAPSVLVLQVEEGMLHAVEYDTDRYGQDGLEFYLFPALAMAAIGAGPAGAAEVSLAGTYTGTLPAASGPGRTIVLTLDPANQAVMTTTGGGDEPAVVELGVWESGADDTVTVVLSGRADGTDYEVPVTITFQPMGDVLTAVVYDEQIYGQQGLQLTRVVAPTQVALIGVVWQLREIQMMDDTVLRPANPDGYTLQFRADGTAEIQADCNRATGPFTLSAPQLSFGPLAVTEAMCAADSLSDRMLQGLTDATSFVLEEGNLAIAFGPDSGILIFVPAAE